MDMVTDTHVREEDMRMRVSKVSPKCPTKKMDMSHGVSDTHTTTNLKYLYFIGYNREASEIKQFLTLIYQSVRNPLSKLPPNQNSLII